MKNSSYDSSAKFELHKTRPDLCSCVGSRINPIDLKIKRRRKKQNKLLNGSGKSVPFFIVCPT
jgi:hypothetical protein